MPKPHQLVLLSTAIALAACANTPQSNRSILSKEQAMTQTTTETHRPIKRYNDGSTPFTMQEIEERLLKVFALPPDQINKASVEQIFGVELSDSETPTFYEKISEEDQMAFSISALVPVGSSSLFRYDLYKKANKTGEERYLSAPKDIPDAYKIPYLPFAKKLEERGWKFHGRDYNYGFFYHFFQKDGYLVRMWIDTLKRRGDEFDHSDSKISSIVIKTIRTYNK